MGSGGADRSLSDLSGPYDPDERKHKIAAMMRLTDQAVDTVRRIASELRPGILDDLGLVEAVDWQARQFQARTGIICRFECLLESADLSPEQSTAVFRIVQEALTNVLRHAKATQVDIVMEQLDVFVVTITDNGRGITENQKTRPSSLGDAGAGPDDWGSGGCSRRGRQRDQGYGEDSGFLRLDAESSR